MRKISCSILILCMFILVGCNNTKNKTLESNKSNETKVQKEHTVQKEDIKIDNNNEINSNNKAISKKDMSQNLKTPINKSKGIKTSKGFEKKLEYNKDFISGKEICYRGKYLILKDNCDSLITIYENFKKLYSIKGDYFGVFASPYEDSFIIDSYDFHKNIYRIYKYDIKTKKKSIFYESKEPLFSIGWKTEGIYCYKVSWNSIEVRPEYADKIYLLKPNKELKCVCNINEKEFYAVDDISGDWLLLSNYFCNKVFKYNMKTKQKIYFKGFNHNKEIQGLSFLNSSNTLLAGEQTDDGRGYKISIIENNTKKTIKKINKPGNLIGTIKNGFVYEVDDSKPGSDKSVGALWVKILK